jgi:hypothetical protein
MSAIGAVPLDHVLIFKRRFQSPRHLVWEAWTKPEHLGRWWGPNGFTTAVVTMDVRTGGAFVLDMQAPMRAPSDISDQLRAQKAGNRGEPNLQGRNAFLCRLISIVHCSDKRVGPVIEKGLADLKAIAEKWAAPQRCPCPQLEYA